MIERKNTLTKSFIKKDESILERKSEKSEASQKVLKKKTNFIKSMIKSDRKMMVKSKEKVKKV
jgi:hypothetical protein